MTGLWGRSAEVLVDCRVTLGHAAREAEGGRRLRFLDKWRSRRTRGRGGPSEVAGGLHSHQRHRKEPQTMTEQEAYRLAWDFVQAGNYDVDGIESSRLLRAKDHAHEDLKRGDLWIVVFARKMPSGMTEFPGEIIIEVECTTGQVSLFGTP